MKKYTLSFIFLLFVLCSCKKDNINFEDNNANQIININNNPDPSRVSSVNNNSYVDFVQEKNILVAKGSRTKSNPAFQLVFKGKIDALKDNGVSLGAVQVASLGNFFAVSYLKSGADFSGGMDVFRLSNGVPQLLSTVKTPNADITTITSGGGRFFIGTDLQNFETFNYPSPAVLGVVNVIGGALNNPQIIPLSGFSVKDLKYNSNNQKLYAATSTQGGLSVISFNNRGVGSRTAYTNYNRLRSLALANNRIIGGTSTEYRSFNLNNANLIGGSKLWPVRSDIEEIGSLNILSNGNLLFGNNYSLIYVNPNTNELLDDVNVGGWINSISIVNDNLYIATGNSIITARIVNGEIVILARAHLYSLFPGIRFDVMSLKVVDNYVVAACGSAGVYVFELRQL
ncbi:hypothetical protein PBAC_10330 [Pedobacter glucosidilyticus]|nr:hypothetical protein [Pedobacter glucosidilyticus]KHJ38695.1 hypothetical protein PBAC_10330 [Pedobacter glucosidilyticus]